MALFVAVIGSPFAAPIVPRDRRPLDTKLACIRRATTALQPPVPMAVGLQFTHVVAVVALLLVLWNHCSKLLLRRAVGGGGVRH